MPKLYHTVLLKPIPKHIMSNQDCLLRQMTVDEVGSPNTDTALVQWKEGSADEQPTSASSGSPDDEWQALFRERREHTVLHSIPPSTALSFQPSLSLKPVQLLSSPQAERSFCLSPGPLTFALFGMQLVLISVRMLKGWLTCSFLGFPKWGSERESRMGGFN